MKAAIWSVAAIAAFSTAAAGADSICFGTPARGRLAHGAEIPLEGPNFTPYSKLLASTGRTYVHSKVRDTVVAAYAVMEKSAPDNMFVYGETGWAAGGR